METADGALRGREGVIVLDEIDIDTDLAETPQAVRLGQEAACVAVLGRHERHQPRRGEGLDLDALHHPPWTRRASLAAGAGGSAMLDDRPDVGTVAVPIVLGERAGPARVSM